MNGLEEAPETIQRAVVGSIIAYFVLVAVDILTDLPFVGLAADVLFGFIAIGIGAVLVTRMGRGETTPTVAGAALVLGGLAQLAWVAVREPVLNGVATVGVLVGILLYLYAVRIAN